MKSAFTLSVSLIALLCASSIARAAEADVADNTTENVTEVIVTGEKAARSLQNTQSSVAVTTSRKIEYENIQNFYDVVNRTANMSETYGAMGFTIRGISNLNVSGGGAGSLATIYVDGAAMTERGATSGPLEMWDIGQVEIFRGPQSTLQGKNALAGAVIIRSKDPTFTYEGRARVLGSDQGDRAAAVAFGGPIIDEQLAFRISAERRNSDGYTYNVTRDADESPSRITTARAKLLMRPKAVEGLEVIATYTHSDSDTGYMYAYTNTDVPNYFDNRQATSDYPNSTRTRTDIFTVEGRYNLSEHWDLTTVLSYNRYDSHLKFDMDLSELPISFGIQDQLAKTFSQEVRLNYSGDAFHGVIGVYHSHVDNDMSSDSLTNVETPVQTIIGGLMLNDLDEATATYVANLYASVLPVIPVQAYSHSPVEVENSALFMDGSWQITPKLSLLGGLRYDRETHTLANLQQTTFVGTYPDPMNFPGMELAIGGINALVAYQVGLANSEVGAQARTFEAWLPKLGVKYEFNDAMSLSFIAQQGYRSGGSVVNLARSRPVPYDPEYTNNYELAWRSAWLNNSLTLNANVYYIDWTDQQVNVFMGLNEYDYETKNAGSSHLHGFEIEVAQRLNNNFDWYASLGHTRTKFEDFVLDEGTLFADFNGNEFAYAPRWTFSAGGTWRADNGFFVNLNGNYRSENYQGVENSIKVKARTLVNTKVGYEFGQYAAYVYANNLLDEKFLQYDRPEDYRAVLGAPRTIGLILEARF
ncbi:MAG: TonB-dependent receptor [Asticcacaulis sp.]